jgi:methyl-accepting chemotaxis protein
MKWTIGRKIGCGFALAILGMIAGGFMSRFSNEKLIGSSSWVEHTYKVIGNCQDILAAMLEAESSQRGFLLTGDEAFLQPYKSIKNRTAQTMKAIREVVSDNPTQQARVALLEQEIDQRLKTLQEGIDERNKEGHAGSAQAIDRGKDIMDSLRKTLAEMIREENGLLANRLDEESNMIRQTKTETYLGIVMSIALLSVIGIWITRDIVVPLGVVSDAAQKIAGGEFAVSLPSSERSDEVGVLVRAFDQMAKRLTDMAGLAKQIAARNLKAQIKPLSERDEVGNAFLMMAENLRRTIGDIAEGANVLSSASSEILASTTQVASSAAETSAAVTETTATVEEVKQTAEMSNQKARYVSECARRATQVAQAGQKTVDATIGGMKRVKTQMEFITESVVRLSEQSHAIGEIIASVNDLAEQSNLLAVNAAIEAAKAGEQGKGFTVVAQEIKSLAAQSKQATAQVRAILGEIQKATTTSVLATEQGSKAVEEGLKQSAEAGDAIRTLAENINEAAQAATQISASCAQQVIGTDQVAMAMENIKQASTQNVAGTRQSETAAHNLHELGQKLQRLIEGFQI